MLKIPICPACHGRSVHSIEGHGCNECKGGGLICPPIPLRMAFSVGFPNVAGVGRGAHTSSQVAPGVSIPGLERKVESQENDRPKLNAILRNELEYAGIRAVSGPLLDHPEVFTNISGVMPGWTFTRSWRYWVASSDTGLAMEHAEKLQAYMGHSARAGGDCACRGPGVWGEGGVMKGYHLDSQDGLNALAASIRFQLHEEWRAEETIRMDSIQAARDQLRKRELNSFPAIHPHDCDKCVYLGSLLTYKGLKSEDPTEWRDYYHCPNASGSEGGSILARWGKDGEYSSFDVPTVAKYEDPKPGTWIWHGQRLIKKHGIEVPE